MHAHILHFNCLLFCVYVCVCVCVCVFVCAGVCVCLFLFFFDNVFYYEYMLSSDDINLFVLDFNFSIKYAYMHAHILNVPCV